MNSQRGGEWAIFCDGFRDCNVIGAVLDDRATCRDHHAKRGLRAYLDEICAPRETVDAPLPLLKHSVVF